MKRKIAVFFMLMFLISTTEFGQLLKFPLLVEHYVEHKGLNPDLTIWGFLQIHYDNNHKEDGDPTDEKLPFVSHAPIMHIVATTPPTMLKIERIKISTHNTKVERFHDAVFESSFLSSIWQPPKYC
ncbi:hypothetical protein [Myroides sp. WP-1]|uniref:hypothetical protein n=1 Tax=Myroides sp. WP-1 TaxID=2759944 RepID=UPI00351C3C55